MVAAVEVVEVRSLECFASGCQVEVAAVAMPSSSCGSRKGEHVLDVGGAHRVVATARRALGARRSCSPAMPWPTYQSKASSRQYSNTSSDSGVAEELDLHLLELARAEGAVLRRDLVAERLADLGDAERRPLGEVCSTFLKLTNIPCAVSGRR